MENLSKQEFENKKEIHIFLDYIHNYKVDILDYGFYVDIKNSRANLQRAIISNEKIIFTYQTCACSTENLIKGYKIFVYMLDNEKIEIKLGSDNKYCDKEIRKAHNLEKMLLANVFGLANIENYS